MKATQFMEELKDNLFQNFVYVAENYPDMYSFKHSMALSDAKEKTWNEIFNNIGAIRKAAKCNYEKALEFGYKIWIGVIFRAKCSGLPCSEFMHPFEILDYVSKINHDQIVIYFDNTKNWKSAIKHAKKIRQNSMITKPVISVVDMSMIVEASDKVSK